MFLRPPPWVPKLLAKFDSLDSGSVTALCGLIKLAAMLTETVDMHPLPC